MTTPSSSAKPLAVVTGASSGIGSALAKQFAQHDFDLLVASETTSPTSQAAFEELGANVTSVTADLSTYDGVESFWQQIQADGRPIDAIAINAGVGVGGDFRETDLAAELKLIDLNIKSTVHLAKRVVPAMTAQKRLAEPGTADK